MKYLIGIIAVLAIAGGAYYFVTQTSRVPEGVEQAVVSDEGTVPSDSGTGSSAATGTPVAASDRVAIANTTLVAQNLDFKFTGYGPGGKQHTGTFTSITTGDVKTGENGLPVSGKVIFKGNTVVTDTAAVDKHLCSDDFFNCAKYPEIVFEYKGIREDAANSSFAVTGALTLNGVTKDISFPVKHAGALAFSSDFLLDTTPFQLKYVGINKDVRVQFSFDFAQDR
ncbi:MAG TPA: YceI family protein [Candidatus Paceibacterota bacterium]